MSIIWLELINYQLFKFISYEKSNSNLFKFYNDLKFDKANMSIIWLELINYQLFEFISN